MKSKIIGIISIKGGVGKTTTVVNLATVIANTFKKKVLVVDSNISAPNLGLHLGLPEPEFSLHDVLDNKLLTKEAIYKHEYGFDVLPSTVKGSFNNIMNLKEKLKSIKRHYEVILLDTSPTINKELLAAMKASDEMFVITTPDRITLDMTIRATKVAKEKGTPIMGLILNRVRYKKYELDPERIEKRAKVPVIATIRESHKIQESLHKTKPTTITNPHSNIAVEFKELAAAILNAKYKKPSSVKRLLNYLREDIDAFKQHNFKKSLKYYK